MAELTESTKFDLLLALLLFVALVSLSMLLACDYATSLMALEDVMPIFQNAESLLTVFFIINKSYLNSLK
jgi:hypothetical protein